MWKTTTSQSAEIRSLIPTYTSVSQSLHLRLWIIAEGKVDKNEKQNEQKVWNDVVSPVNVRGTMPTKSPHHNCPNMTEQEDTDGRAKVEVEKLGSPQP